MFSFPMISAMACSTEPMCSFLKFAKFALLSLHGNLSAVPGTPWSGEESLYIDSKKVTPVLFLLLGREKALMCRLDWIGQPRDCPPI